MKRQTAERLEGPNLYRFARNDPADLIDPDGRFVPGPVPTKVCVRIGNIYTFVAQVGWEIGYYFSGDLAAAVVPDSYCNSDPIPRPKPAKKCPLKGAEEVCILKPGNYDEQGCEYSCPLSGIVWFPPTLGGCPDVITYNPGSIPREE